MTSAGAETYKAQTLAVESLLEHHPEFDPATDPGFSSEERHVFSEVFQPDWSQYKDDYRQVYDHFINHEPESMRQAQAVLKKFFLAHGVDPAGYELEF
ncbi:hypothetical protein HY844_02250 [Candidatus Berkelbacteria bacterium]|nr:hypothetical protein [Candidatus Berkelbacteria bacterium]